MKMERSRSFANAFDMRNTEHQRYYQNITHLFVSKVFWDSIVLAINISAPIVIALRFVDGDKKPTLPCVFECIIKAKTEVAKVNSPVQFMEIINNMINQFFISTHSSLQVSFLFGSVFISYYCAYLIFRLIALYFTWQHII